MSHPNGDTKSLGRMVADITSDLSSLIRGEIELAKSEMKESARNAGAAVGLLAGVAFVAVLAIIFLLISAAYGLVAAGVPISLAFLIVAVVLILIGVTLGLVARSKLKKVKGPERAKVQQERTKSVFTRRFSSEPDVAVVVTKGSSSRISPEAPVGTVPPPGAPVPPLTTPAATKPNGDGTAHS